jgi:hypothetical protein
MQAPMSANVYKPPGGDGWVVSDQGEVDMNVPASRGTSVWSWLLVVIAVLVVIGFIIWYIIWSTKTNNSGGISTALTITGVQFSVVNDTTIQATWATVGDPADVVIMYANPTGQTMKFDKSGNPLGSYSKSTPVATPNTSASIGGLTSGSTYDAVLVVTNSNFPGQCNTGQHQSGLVLSPRGTVPIRFSIQAAGQGGQIRYYPSTSNPSVVAYTLNDATVAGTLFHQDSDGYICATNQSQTLTASTSCDNGSYVLYSKPTTNGTNELGIIQKSQLATSALPTAKWQYNAGGKNEWCLFGSSQCMTYDPKSPTISVNTGTSTTTTTAAGTTTTTTNTNNFVPLITNQKVTVTSQGTRWNNQNYT